MRLSAALTCALLVCTYAGQAAETTKSITFHLDEEKGELKAGSLFTYNFSDQWALPHFYPLNTPSGKNLLVQKTEPYPHHRAFWVADTVERDGVVGDIYNGYYSGKKLPRQAGNRGIKRNHGAPFDTRSRHLAFEFPKAHNGQSRIKESLVWETSCTSTAFPLLQEHRQIDITPMAEGQYFLDFRFSLTASYGDVKFISDQVHYAWPFLRINTQFTPDGGGVLTNDRGHKGQDQTNLKPAKWIDFSNTIDGVAEGVTVFQYPTEDNIEPLWLTRDYGTFGPRRPDAIDGKPFTLNRGESISQRVGIYVHRGDATSADVAGIYRKYVNGDL